MLLYQMRLPRLAYQADELLVYLQSSRPIRVPIEVVELFFGTRELVQLPVRTVSVADCGDSPGRGGHAVAQPAHRHRARAVVRSVHHLARYWREPLTPELFKQLNRRLAEIHRQRLRPG